MRYSWVLPAQQSPAEPSEVRWKYLQLKYWRVYRLYSMKSVKTGKDTSAGFSSYTFDVDWIDGG